MEDEKYKEILRGNSNTETPKEKPICSFDDARFEEGLKNLFKAVPGVKFDHEEDFIRVIFDYTKTEDGHKIHMKCFNKDNSYITHEEYFNCFKDILKYIVSNCL